MVEDLHDRPAEGEVGRRRPLKFIAAVEDDAFARRRTTGGRRLPDGRGKIRRTAAACARDIGPRLECPVKIVGADDAEPRRRSRAPRRGAGRRWGADGARVLAIVSAQLLIECRDCRWRGDVPVADEVVVRHDGALSAHLIDEELANLLLLVVHHRRTAQHRVSAAARLPVVVERQCEAVRGLDSSAAHLEPSHALSHGARQVQRVVRAGDDVEVEAGDRGIHTNAPIPSGGVVTRALLQIGAKLRSGEANGPQGVVIRVEGLHPSRRDGTGVERSVERECRGGCEVGARGSALDLIDEVEQRRIHDARRIGAPGNRRPPDRRVHPANRRPVRRVGGGKHRRTLRMASRLNDARLPRRHAPAALIAGEREMRHANTRRPILWLHEQHAVDDGVADLLVRMPEEDHVDPRDLASRSRRDVLAWHRGRDRVVARRPTEPRVHGDDHDIRSRCAHVKDGGPHRGDDVAQDDPILQIVAVPYHRTRCGRADDANAHSPALHHRPARIGVGAVWAIGVRGQKGEGRLAKGAVLEGKTVVELVIAHGRRVVLHGVHGGHHRVDRRGGGHARRDIRQGVPLEQVPRVE